eukprot:3305870-Prymnesium_polylepis.1
MRFFGESSRHFLICGRVRTPSGVCWGAARAHVLRAGGWISDNEQPDAAGHAPHPWHPSRCRPTKATENRSAHS